MTAKYILSFLLSLMLIILVFACTKSKPLFEPTAIVIKSVSKNISTNTLSFAMNITFDAPYVGVMLKF